MPVDNRDTDPQAREQSLSDAQSPLRIIWQDSHLVAIDKPSGLLVHRSPIDRYETQFAVQQLRDQLGRRVFPIHRLDKPTSGLLLFAFESATVAAIAGQFDQHTVVKHYRAVVRGHAPMSAIIDHPLREEIDRYGRRLAERTARPAETQLERLMVWTIPEPVDRYPEGRYSLVALTPRTGRYRQLRRHMKHISHPVIGDTRYGKGSHNRFFRERFGCYRLLLASVGLEFTHPVNGQRIALSCEPDADFQTVVSALTASHTPS